MTLTHSDLQWRARLAVLPAALWLASPQAALAQADIEQTRAAMSRLIGALAEQGVLSKNRADDLLKDVAAPTAAGQAAANAPGSAAPRGGAVRVGYIPEFVRDDLKRELRAELAQQATREGWAGPGTVPTWVRGISVDGDLRARLQADQFGDGNAPSTSITDTNRNRAPTLANTSEDRQRLRVRARVGVTATIDERWSAGVRLSTGSTSDPLSSNQTLGNYGNRFNVVFDRAYVRWSGGDFNAVAGRFGNPWFGTDLVWANDLGFDGLALQWTPAVGSGTRAFVTAAALPVQEVELAAADKWLFGLQVGADLQRLLGNSSAKLGLGYYHYTSTVGRVSPPGSTRYEFTAPAFAQKGNSYYNISSDLNRPLLGLAADYRLVNFTGSFSVPIFTDKRLMAAVDVVRNIGFDRKQVAARTGVDVAPQTLGWQLRLAMGMPEVARSGDWQVFAGYKRLERDAAPDAFTDSDFRLGGTNAKGYLIGASLGLAKNTAINLRLLSGDSISGPPLAVDVIQLDLNVRY